MENNKICTALEEIFKRRDLLMPSKDSITYQDHIKDNAKCPICSTPLPTTTE